MYPHAATVLSDFNTSEKYPPADIAVTPDKPNGIDNCPCPLLPQPTTVPSVLSASEKYAPAEIAFTFLRPAGTVA